MMMKKLYLTFIITIAFSVYCLPADTALQTQIVIGPQSQCGISSVPQCPAGWIAIGGGSLTAGTNSNSNINPCNPGTIPQPRIRAASSFRSSTSSNNTGWASHHWAKRTVTSVICARVQP